ncbi:MAG: hypothetical protein AAF357_02665 [Verrucomicrobiota bacterium]
MRYVLPLIVGLNFVLSVSAEQLWVDYPGYDDPGYGRKVVLIAGDQEYRSEETLPQLARILAQHHGFDCRVLFCQDPANPGVVDPEFSRHVPGLEALETADLLILGIRFLDLPDNQMAMIDRYLRAGRPVLGLRTSNHGFRIDEGKKWSHYDWKYQGDLAGWEGGFGQVLFGGKFTAHHGKKKTESSRGVIVGGQEDHTILRGIGRGDVWGPTFVYGINVPLRPGCDVLLHGEVLAGMETDSPALGPGPYEESPKSLAPDAIGKNDPMMPLAWTTEYELPDGGRRGLAFHTTLGASRDFEQEGVRRLIVNGVYWLFGITPPHNGCEVSLVGDFETTDFEFRRGGAWQERGLQIASFSYPIEPKSIELPDEPYLNPEYGREGKLYSDHPVNRFRLYDFYTRQAEAMLDLEKRPELLPDYPALDGGHFGHWGAYHKNSYDDQRHNSMATSSAIAAAFNPKGVGKSGKRARVIAFRLGEEGDMACAFDSESMQFQSVWNGDFVRFHPHRWGLGHGMSPQGETWMSSWSKALDGELLGYYQHGDKNVLAYRLVDTLLHEIPAAAGNAFVRRIQFPEGAAELKIPVLAGDGVNYRIDRAEGVECSIDPKRPTLRIARAEAGGWLDLVASQAETNDSLGDDFPRPADLIGGGEDLWEWEFKATGQLNVNEDGAYRHDAIPVPFQNPYGSAMLLGGISFFEDGRAAVTTMWGDVWIVSGLDDELEEVVWKRFATGLNHALGVEVVNGKVIVLGRDRLTRLHDLNDDGMADYYENFSEAFEPSHGGHSFYVGLQKDAEDNLYFTASTHVVKVSPDGKTGTVLNEGGQRNPNGVGVSQSGIVLSTANEGDWNPASFLFEVREGDFYGRNAKPDGPEVAPPLAFVPRGIDNSMGGSLFVEDDRFGLAPGTVISTSFGSGVIYGVLRDTHWQERAQGTVFPMPFDFASGTHRGRFGPHDGQLYLVGVDGWGNYAITDGHLDRVRYVGGTRVFPTSSRAHRNGIELTFADPIDPESVKQSNFLLQQWRYQYSEAYGCRELSARVPGAAGHDEVSIGELILRNDGRSLLIGIPEIIPIECLHVHARLKTTSGESFLLDTFHTLLHLDSDHPALPPRGELLTDTLELDVKFVLGGRDLPWTRNRFPEGTTTRRVEIESLAGLKFDTTLFEATAGEPLESEL